MAQTVRVQFCRRQASFHVAAARFGMQRPPCTNILEIWPHRWRRRSRGPHRRGTVPHILSAVKCQPAYARGFRPAQRDGRNRSCFRGADVMAVSFCSQQPAASCYNARSRSEPQRGTCFDARSARSSRSHWRTSRRAKDYGSDAAVAPPCLGGPPGRGRRFFQKLVIRRQANPSETKETR
jgi:hypothetical protein